MTMNLPVRIAGITILVVAAAALALEATAPPIAQQAGHGSKRPHQAASAAPAVAEPKADAPCPSEVKDAVLNKLFPKVRHDFSAISASFGDVHEADLNAEAEELKCIRDWTNTLERGCVRSAYEHWLDFYAGQLAEAREELRRHTKANDTSSYAAKRQEEDRRVRAYEAAHPIPTPAECKR